ncbi:MAG TPA: iron-containing alcohol dehydrogenase [Spirochaetota bacterium]|nr:iron-containing alcohol dehydrogenase [Spirochaetota bacterium]HPJ33883.1 iron-containing alcohol dehydrogenase [Spirochaetota bacterium]
MSRQIQPEFHLPTEIYIKPGISRNSSEILSKFGTRAVIITVIPDFEIYQEKLAELYSFFRNINIGCIIYDEIPGDPTTEDIDVAVSFIKKTRCDLVIGFGGVQSINSAKAIALLSSNFMFCHDLLDTDREIGNPVTLITMPAYPCFGFEISPLFFLKEIQQLTHKVYYNLNLYPTATIVDPELTFMASEEKMLRTSLGSLALATESVISTMNNDVINTYALKAIDLIFRNLPVTYKEPGNIVPRNYLSTASVMSGIAFSVAYLSVSLAISLALSSRGNIDVDTAVALIIPHIMEFNLTTSPGKYVQMSKVMGEDVKDITVIEAAIKAVEAVRKLEIDVAFPQRLSSFNITQDKFGQVADLANTFPFIKNTPRMLSKSEIETILIAAF